MRAGTPPTPRAAILTEAEVVSVRRDTTGRSVHMKTAAGRERELAYGEILVAACRHRSPGDARIAARRSTGPHLGVLRRYCMLP